MSFSKVSPSSIIFIKTGLNMFYFIECFMFLAYAFYNFFFIEIYVMLNFISQLWFNYFLCLNLVQALCTAVSLLATVPLGELFFFHIILIRKVGHQILFLFASFLLQIITVYTIFALSAGYHDIRICCCHEVPEWASRTFRRWRRSTEFTFFASEFCCDCYEWKKLRWSGSAI